MRPEVLAAPVLAAAVVPDWPAPAGIGALMTTREGGVSAPPWNRLNLGLAVGDDPAAVAENRSRLAAAIGARPVYLRQVHGAGVAVVDAADADPSRPPIEADAAVTVATAVACVVQVADCLPVLLSAAQGRAVGAAHAGWRGLAGGVVERTLQRLCDLAGCAPGEVQAWLGPCIGPARFEVGADVLLAFGVEPDRVHPHFVARARADGSARWLCDLAGLARERLLACGVAGVAVQRDCTFDDRSRFFSFRRDGVTGRHVAAVWRRPGG
jgi:YfiH family protein